MKFLELSARIMEIFKKNKSFHNRITKIMKLIKFHAIILKIIKKKINERITKTLKFLEFSTEL